MVSASMALHGQSLEIVRTADGSVRGSVADGVASWKGIPFAAPPTGSLRWRAPQPAKQWTGTRETIAYQHDCMQLPFGGDAAPLGTAPAEDCLYLNVWRPAQAAGRLPVLVWIYGGGWVNGGASPPTYSGAPLAKEGILVASFNYRVGRFGWFAHPQLTRADADKGLLINYGILDQIAALQWIQKNIAAFGGDPGNVTVMGESAGGVSIHVLNTSTLTKGLYHKAISMSGGNGGDLGTATLADAEAVGLNFARRKGIADDDPEALAKLRALSPEEITDGLNLSNSGTGEPRAFTGGPIVDGKIVTHIGQMYASGAFRRVPMMIGATSGDMGGRTGFMIGGARLISATLGDKGIPTYYYRFSYAPQSVDREAAGHASDIPFFMNTQALKYGAKTTDRDNAAGRVVSRFVVDFVKAAPKDPQLPGWPRYQRQVGKMMNFSREGTAELIDDPWASEIDNAPAPRFPGLATGDAARRPGGRP
jgi:para-nitrobenzyl esterase